MRQECPARATAATALKIPASVTVQRRPLRPKGERDLIFTKNPFMFFKNAKTRRVGCIAKKACGNRAKFPLTACHGQGRPRPGPMADQGRPQLRNHQSLCGKNTGPDPLPPSRRCATTQPDGCGVTIIPGPASCKGVAPGQAGTRKRSGRRTFAPQPAAPPSPCRQPPPCAIAPPGRPRRTARPRGLFCLPGRRRSPPRGRL